MNNFIFQNSTRVYFGKGCVKEYLACLTKGANTILLAYGGGSIKRSGVYDEITEILHDAGKTVVEFPGIMSNPTYAKVQAGAKLARARGVEMILAVGGGASWIAARLSPWPPGMTGTSGTTFGLGLASLRLNRCLWG